MNRGDIQVDDFVIKVRDFQFYPVNLPYEQSTMNAFIMGPNGPVFVNKVFTNEVAAFRNDPSDENREIFIQKLLARLV